MIECYFENHKNQKIDLMESPYFLQTGEFYNSSWSYDYVELVGGGSKITNLTKGLKLLPLTLSISCRGREAYNNAVNHFHDVIDIDVFEQIPGKLYVDGYYLKGYFVDCQTDAWEYGVDLQDRTVKFLAENPMWRKDVLYSYGKRTTASDYEYLNIPYDTPYDILPDALFQSLLNDSGKPCEFTMIIYGPCVNPEITIDGHVYGMEARAYDGEFIKIDSEASEITRYTIDGVTFNLYNARKKEISIFEPIPSKNNVVNWDNSFGFDITIHKERGEPIWNL